MKAERCYFYRNNKCLIFENCNDKKAKKCDWFCDRRTGYPEHFISHLMFTNTITQARAIVFQRRYTKVLIGLTVILGILTGLQIYLKSF